MIGRKRTRWEARVIRTERERVDVHFRIPATGSFVSIFNNRKYVNGTQSSASPSSNVIGGHNSSSSNLASTRAPATIAAAQGLGISDLFVSLEDSSSALSCLSELQVDALLAPLGLSTFFSHVGPVGDKEKHGKRGEMKSYRTVGMRGRRVEQVGVRSN